VRYTNPLTHSLTLDEWAKLSELVVPRALRRVPMKTRNVQEKYVLIPELFKVILSIDKYCL